MEKTQVWIDGALRILEKEAAALTGLMGRIGEAFTETVELVLGLEGRIVTTGMGKAGIIAQKISATLASTGTPSIYLHPVEALHGDLGRVLSQDLVLALSKSGETEELLHLLPLVKATGVKVVAITESRDSPLGRHADQVLELGRIHEAGHLGLAPSASTLAMLALGDALSLVVQEARDFGPEEFARFHPGGQLGRKLLQVSEIMRKGEGLPFVKSGSTVRQALVTMTETPGRPGAAIVIDENGEMLGLFTDGDLRRGLKDSTISFLDLVIDEVMTKSPRTIQANRLAAEALSMIQQIHTDQLPVVDEGGRPVGLVDVQDLLELRITT